MMRTLNSPKKQLFYRIRLFNDLTFPEYIFRTYLEKIHIGYNMKKISNGIYYINDKIYIAYSDNTISPRIVKNGNPDITSSDYDILIGKNQLPAYSILHTDTQNIVKWEQKGEDPLTHCIPGYYRDNNFTLQDYNRYTENGIYGIYI